jgi:hypothetical protein
MPAQAVSPWPQVKSNLKARLAPALFSGLSVGLGAVVLGANPATGVTLGLADAVLRPLARGLYTDYRRNASRRAAARRAAEREEALNDGDGI